MWVVHMRFNLRCGLPAPASLAGWLNSDVERLLSYVQFSKAKDSNRCKTVITDLRKSCKTPRSVWYMSACNGILTGHEAKQP